MHLPFLANLTDLPWVAIVSICGSFLIAIVVPLFAMYFQHQKRQLWHETARIALEKGQPVPSQSEETKVSDDTVRENLRHDRGQRNDLRAGLVLIGVGASLYLFLGTFLTPSLGLIGTIPGFIGVALLLHALLITISARKNTPPSDRS